MCYCVQTMHFVEALLEYASLLGDIFQGQNSFSLGTSDSEKKKAVGQYLGMCCSSEGHYVQIGNVITCSASFRCSQPQHGTQGSQL